MSDGAVVTALNRAADAIDSWLDEVAPPTSGAVWAAYKQANADAARIVREHAAAEAGRRQIEDGDRHFSDAVDAFIEAEIDDSEFLHDDRADQRPLNADGWKSMDPQPRIVRMSLTSNGQPPAPDLPVVSIDFGADYATTSASFGVTSWTEQSPWWMFWRRIRNRSFVTDLREPKP